MAFLGMQNSGTYTPADVERKRRLAEMLAGKDIVSQEPFGALAEGLIGARSGYESQQASEAEKAGIASANKSLAEMLADPNVTVEQLLGETGMGNPWANSQQQAILAQLVGQKMTPEDPMKKIQLEQAMLDLEQDRNSRPERKYVDDPNGVPRYVDTGEAVFPEVQPAPKLDIPSGYQQRTDGQPGLMPIPGGPADPSTPGKTTEAQRRNQQLGSVIAPELETVEENWKALTDFGNQAANADVPFMGKPGYALTSPEFQKADNALTTIIASYLYSVSGATATDEEIKRQKDILTPKVGESEESTQQKLARIRVMAEAVADAGGVDLPEKAVADEGDEQITEGTVIENDQGERLVLKNGKWVPLNG